MLALTSPLPLVLAACTTAPLDLPAETGSGSTSATTEPPITTGPVMTSTSGRPTTTSGADTSSSGSSGTTDGDFITKPDGACYQVGPGGSFSTRCLIECDVAAQDCGEGRKCMPWANDGGEQWNASRCSDVVPDPVPLGGTCTVEGSPVSGIDDCDVGSMCWGVDPETLQGTCVEFCNPLRRPSTVCIEPEACINLNSGYVPVCLDPCNPLQDAACPEGEACRSVEPEAAFYCLPLVGGQVEGSSQHCDGATCLASQLCLPAEVLGTCGATRCCTELCDLGDPGADAQCAALDPLLGCEPLYEPGTAPPGLELVGACVLPP